MVINTVPVSWPFYRPVRRGRGALADAVPGGLFQVVVPIYSWLAQHDYQRRLPLFTAPWASGGNSRNRGHENISE